MPKKPDYSGSLTFDEYGRFSNTGGIFRRWRFGEDIPDLDVSKGDYLFDEGPDRESKRFSVRTDESDTWQFKRRITSEEVKPLLCGRVPEWNPQGFHNRKIRDELADVTKAVKDIIYSIERLIRAANPTPGSTSKKAKSGFRNSDTLEFLGEHTWSNGDPFWLWRFLTDYEPLGAEKGQILRQDSGDWYVYPRGDDDHRWVSPELACRVVRKWLNLQPGGTDYEGSGEVPEGESEDVPRATGRTYFSELNRRGKPLVDPDYPDRPQVGACVCLKDVPEIGASRGDVLVFSREEKGFPARMYGSVRGLGLDDYEILRAAILEHGHESLFHDLILGRDTYGKEYSPISTFIHYRGQWGKQLKVFYSRLVLLKPWVNYRSLSDPISAASDEGAIWTLLYDVGCALPLSGYHD